jgi:hypothetical protein
MKVLLDSSIVLDKILGDKLNQDVQILFKWLNRSRCQKVIHSKTIEELQAKGFLNTQTLNLAEYEILTNSMLMNLVDDESVNTALLNEIVSGKVDVFVSENEKIHEKAKTLNISDKVFDIDRFLEKIFAENPKMIDYKVLNVQKIPFGMIDLNDPFFQSLKDDYSGFAEWFQKKYNETAYITINSNKGKLLSFLYLKIEGEDEKYADVIPPLPPKKRLKVGTFKVISNGFRLGERFLKIIFDNALKHKVGEIYVTIFDRSNEQKRLIGLMEKWGFTYWGKKGEENVYVRDFSPVFDSENVHKTYPYISKNRNTYIVPIYPEYHTELLPDSILNTESPEDFVEDSPHRNGISKVYVSRALVPHPTKGDILVFYRTGGLYKGVITTIGMVTDTRDSFANKDEFIEYCLRGSVFPEKELEKMWDYKPQKPFVVKFLYVYSFPKRINMKRLIDMGIFKGVNDAPRGFFKISKAQFESILKETTSEGRFVVD